MVSANDSEDRRTDVNRRDALSKVGDDGATESNRRRFLAGAAASVAATLGFSGTAVALDPTGEVELRQLRQQYQSNAREAADDHGGDLLALLAEAGYLSEASIDAFDEFGVSAWRVGETATARIDGRIEQTDGQFSISIEPETGRAYAIDDSGDDWTVLTVGTDGTLESKAVTPEGTVCLSSSLSCTYCQVHNYSCETDGCHIGPTDTCCTNCQSTCPC